MNTISMHILDIVQNSIRAKATFIEIVICEDIKANGLNVLVKDNGIGMDDEFLAQVTDPYTTTRLTRKVGLGLPLLRHSAEQANGGILVCSKKGGGTSIQASFQYEHLDRPPLGDVAGTIVLLVAANPKIEFKYIHQLNNKKYEFNTLEIKEVLGDVLISDPKIRGFLKEMIIENIDELYVV